MVRLKQSDLEAVLAFLGDVGEVESDEPYAPELLGRLHDLIPCESIGYQEFDFRARRDIFLTGIDPDGAYRWDAATDSVEPDDSVYWRVGPCPIVHYRIRKRYLGAVRMSDVISRRRFRELPVYRDYFRLGRIEHFLDLGLPERAARQRSLILFRARGDADFSDRDRTLLEMLRPHLYNLERHAGLRRELAEALGKQGPAERDEGAYQCLTAREREIVELVAEGKTNAEIAAQLWVAPSTVKKHLEHVYAKLGVGRRAALAAAHHTARR